MINSSMSFSDGVSLNIRVSYIIRIIYPGDKTLLD